MRKYMKLIERAKSMLNIKHNPNNATSSYHIRGNFIHKTTLC